MRTVCLYAGGVSTDKLRVVVIDDHDVVRAGLRALFDGDENLEVVGEAAKRVPANQRQQYPQVPWQRIAGLVMKRCQDPIRGFLGRPSGRNVDSNPKRRAVCWLHGSSPKGLPRRTLQRTACNSVSVWGAFT